MRTESGPGRKRPVTGQSARRVGLFAIVPLLLALACGGGDGDGNDGPAIIITPTSAQQPTQVSAPTQPAAAPTTEPAAPLEHVVEAGETLGSIAEQFGVTVEAIAAANEIEDPDLIAVGQRLIIPVPETAPAP